jgi:hypothetical protein
MISSLAEVKCLSQTVSLLVDILTVGYEGFRLILSSFREILDTRGRFGLDKYSRYTREHVRGGNVTRSKCVSLLVGNPTALAA